MKAIILEPGKAPYMQELRGDYAELWNLVDGYIECMRVSSSAVALFDEEGLLKGKKPGHVIEDAHGFPHHIVGTAVILGVRGGESNFCDVPDALIRLYNLG